jgi:ATP-dependent Lon protease
LIPKENEKDFKEDIPDEVKSDIQVYFCDTMDELLSLVLEKQIKIKNIKSKIIRPFAYPSLQ